MWASQKHITPCLPYFCLGLNICEIKWSNYHLLNYCLIRFGNELIKTKHKEFETNGHFELGLIRPILKTQNEYLCNLTKKNDKHFFETKTFEVCQKKVYTSNCLKTYLNMTEKPSSGLI